MSFWTHVRGIVSVDVPGKSDAECRYFIETVLNHLPKVTGSESDLDIYLIRKNGYNISSSVDEFNNFSNLLSDNDNCMHNLQSGYLIVIYDSLRDRLYEDTFKEFSKWLTRLSKRVIVDCVDVVIEGFSEKSENKSVRICKSYSEMANLFDDDRSWPDNIDNSRSKYSIGV